MIEADDSYPVEHLEVGVTVEHRVRVRVRVRV
jgi:hypothetical protein